MKLIPHIKYLLQHHRVLFCLLVAVDKDRNKVHWDITEFNSIKSTINVVDFVGYTSVQSY